MVQMRILSQSILGGLRRSNVATSPASVHRLVSTSRHLLSFMGSGTPRWWSSALARRVSPRFAAANRSMRHVSQVPHGSRNMASSSVVRGEELDKPDRLPFNPTAKGFLVSLEDEMRARVNIISGDEDACRTTLEVMDNKPDTTGGNVHIVDCELSSGDKESWPAEVPGYPMDDVDPMDILPDSSHRDGSIYSCTPRWKRDFRIADRNETRQEAMMFSDPTDCDNINGTCWLHSSCHMLQIFSLKLAIIPVERGPVELYGYIAARDMLDRLLNYVINFSRDDPIVVEQVQIYTSYSRNTSNVIPLSEQGSLINMAGPKRGIQLVGTTLIEYDMKIKTGRHENEDLQLIDGVSFVDNMDTWNCSPFTCRMHGGCGVIDMTASCLNFAVEATVEVAISQVQSNFSMHLGCFTSGIHDEIRLFQGAIAESCDLKRSVIAVVLGAQMDLKFEVAAVSCIPVEHCCSFKATKHGRATQEIKTDFASIAVKVTWSTLV
ncbi:unnamed protein product [Urochloa decumbens]|uniref:DUF6598 domain-containing protein n=1 Tax=Urochloa decumbens TaxID=240449 RepID=A0ABC9A2P8_9POAL